MSPQRRVARLPKPVRLTVDVRAAAALCGTLLKYLSVSSLLPTAVALGYGEPFWPFLAAGGIAALAGIGLERLGRPAGNVGFREG